MTQKVTLPKVYDNRRISLGWSLVKPNQINPKKTAISETQDATGWLEKKIATRQVKLDKTEVLLNVKLVS